MRLCLTIFTILQLSFSYSSLSADSVSDDSENTTPIPIEAAEITVADPAVIESLEIEVVVSEPKKKKLILNWLEGIQTTPKESAHHTIRSVGDIRDHSLNEVKKAWQKDLQTFANTTWNPVSNCPRTFGNDTTKAFQDLVNVTPKILMGALGEKAVARFDSVDDLLDIPITLAKPFVKDEDIELTEGQKAIALGAVTMTGLAAGSVYLSKNEVSFTESIPLEIKPDFANSMSIKIGGENLGFESKNPHIILGTTIKTNKGTSLGVTGGASHVSSKKKKGKESIHLVLTHPTIDNENSLQTLKIFGGASSVHQGKRSDEKFTGGKYGGGVVYSITPRFDPKTNPDLGNLKLKFTVAPIQFSGDMIIDPSTGLPRNRVASSSAQSTFNYKIDSTSSITSFGVSVNGSLNYQPDGTVLPEYGGNFSVSVTPRKKVHENKKRK